LIVTVDPLIAVIVPDRRYDVGVTPPAVPLLEPGAKPDPLDPPGPLAAPCWPLLADVDVEPEEWSTASATPPPTIAPAAANAAMRALVPLSRPLLADGVSAVSGVAAAAAGCAYATVGAAQSKSPPDAGMLGLVMACSWR